MKRRSNTNYFRTLSALALSACMMLLSSFALAQDQVLGDTDEGASAASGEEMFGHTAPLYEALGEADEQSGTEEGSEETASAEEVLGQHTSTLYRGRLNHR